MVEGGAWGGACDLAFVCDIIVASPTASFAITPAKIGVPYNCSGILHFMNVLGLHTVKEMFFTAEPLSAERAVDVGIVNHLVPAEELEAFTYAIARKITALSPLALRVIKEQLRILSGCISVSPETFERIEGLRRLAYESADYREGIAAFLEKRKPVFRGE
jgi:methylmalonyl-CoA decarboxylase